MSLIAQYDVATTLFEVLTKEFSVASVCSRYIKGLDDGVLLRWSLFQQLLYVRPLWRTG